jgi:hypothetical protein
MRNIFDQYKQPENRLTHALVTALDQDRSLLPPFLRWLGIRDVSKPKKLLLNEQQVPGSLQDDADELETKGLPDATVFNDDGWAVLFESKVQAPVKLQQISRHRETAKRHGFESPWLVVISVDKPPANLPSKAIAKTWQEIYLWFSNRTAESFWAEQLVQYMQVFEQKMLAQDYQIRGTITVFDGLKFDDKNPYTYREAKRLIRLLGDELQRRKDLHKIGVDPNGKRRSAITGRGTDAVWDFLPLTVARNAKQFTSFPHLTMGINRSRAIAAATVPNGVKGGFRRKLKEAGFDGFLELLADIEKRLRPVVKRSGAKPVIYVTQRHYASQRSEAVVDARLEADLRTAFVGADKRVRHQPEWVVAIYDSLVGKRSNIQFGVDVQFSYACPLVRSPKAVDLFADSWKAIAPLVRFVTQG